MPLPCKRERELGRGSAEISGRKRNDWTCSWRCAAGGTEPLRTEAPPRPLHLNVPPPCWARAVSARNPAPHPPESLLKQKPWPSLERYRSAAGRNY